MPTCECRMLPRWSARPFVESEYWTVMLPTHQEAAMGRRAYPAVLGLAASPTTPIRQRLAEPIGASVLARRMPFAQ